MTVMKRFKSEKIILYTSYISNNQPVKTKVSFCENYE